MENYKRTIKRDEIKITPEIRNQIINQLVEQDLETIAENIRVQNDTELLHSILSGETQIYKDMKTDELKDAYIQVFGLSIEEAIYEGNLVVNGDEATEEIKNLAYENKQMAQALLDIGFTQDQVESICYGVKVTPIFTDERFKAHAIGIYTSGSKNGAQDYEEFMEGESDLSVWAPLEREKLTDLQELVESEFCSIKRNFTPHLIEQTLVKSLDDEIVTIASKAPQDVSLEDAVKAVSKSADIKIK